jgi:hypothetical protein
VGLHFDGSTPAGFREFSTTIRASGKQLLLTNYESLTMAAQFAVERLPAPHDMELLVPVQPGLYRCRVIQRFDPETHSEQVGDGTPDFDIELGVMDTAERPERLEAIPWAVL